MSRKQKQLRPETPGRHRPGLTEAILLFSPFLTGPFYLWGAALAVIGLTAALLLKQRKEALRFFLSPLLLACGSLVLFQLGGCLWGTDRGMALAGALQFLPLPLFVLALQQRELEERMQMLRFLPHTAAAMVFLTILLSLLPSCADRFLVNGRLAGFFQYPNVFAIYLLSALIVLLQGGSSSRKEKWSLFPVLVVGLALTQSKTAAVLLIAVLILSAVRAESGKEKGLLALTAALFAGAGLFLALTGRVSFSTFYGRLLYAQDAVPVILRHPLGLGYTGYYWLQGSFQTGVYSVRHVHNELLQLLLDVGWIPAGLFLWALVQAFRAPDGNFCRRLLLAVLCVHALFDFDTQFVAVAFLLLTAASVEPLGAAGHDGRMAGMRAARKLSPPVFTVVSGLLCLFALWLGTASVLLEAGRPQEAAGLYSAYTEALIRMFPESGDGDLADRILRLNESAAPAWDIRAEDAFQRGDFDTALSAKEEAVRLSRYNQQEYLEYRNMLEQIRLRLSGRGDAAGAARCTAKLEALPGMMEAVLEQTSALGRMIQDRPNLMLPPS